MKVRVQGLKIALTSKLAQVSELFIHFVTQDLSFRRVKLELNLKLSFLPQDYLHIVDSLDIPTPDPNYLLDLIKHRQWGDSVLIVDV